MSLPGPPYCRGDVDRVRQVSVECTNNLRETLQLDSDELNLLLALDKDISCRPPPSPPATPVDMTVVDDAVESLLEHAHEQQQQAQQCLPLDTFHRDQYPRVSDQSLPFDGHTRPRPPLGRRHSLPSLLPPSLTAEIAAAAHSASALAWPPIRSHGTSLQDTMMMKAVPSPDPPPAAAAGGNSASIASIGSILGMQQQQHPAPSIAGRMQSNPLAYQQALMGGGMVQNQNNFAKDDVIAPSLHVRNDMMTLFDSWSQEDIQPLDFNEYMYTAEEVDDAQLSDALEALPGKLPAPTRRASLHAMQQSSCRSLHGHHHSDGTLTLVHADSKTTLHVGGVETQGFGAPSSTTLLTGATSTSCESSPSVDRLHALMAKSIESMKRLEGYDRRQGLRRCDAQNMMNTARSRKQILENRILKKWDGTPLIAFDKCKKTGSITVSAGPKKERMTKRRSSLAGETILSVRDRRKMARRSSM